LQLLLALGFGPFDFVFPCARLHCHPDALVRLQRMPGERLDGEGGCSFVAQRVHRFDHPVAQDPDASQAPLPKPAPVGEQVRDIDREWHAFQQSAQGSHKFLALKVVVHMVAGKRQIAHAPCGLGIEVAQVVQSKITYEHM
jgi:hypothetical protein